MKRKYLFAGIALASLLAALAAWRPPAAAAPEDGIARTCRIRAELVRIRLAPGQDAAPLTLSALGLGDRSALVPAAEAPRADGWFGSVKGRVSLAGFAEGRGHVATELRGEAEMTGQMEISIGRQFPVRSIDVRGNQSIVTTRFEKTGLSVKLMREADEDVFQARLTFSAVEAFAAGPEGSKSPVIGNFSTEGMIRLPDAHTAVFSFSDRVGAEVLGTDGDVVAWYVLLLTRLDLVESSGE